MVKLSASFVSLELLNQLPLRTWLVKPGHIQQYACAVCNYVREAMQGSEMLAATHLTAARAVWPMLPVPSNL